MKFGVLRDNLRKLLRNRIAAGELTGSQLARQARLRQPHISNFLSGKRSLSLEAMDHVLEVQRLSVLDLLDPEEINKRATILPPGDDEFENVALVSTEVAASSQSIVGGAVLDLLKFKKSFLRRLRPDMATPRQSWRRFVLIKADAREALSMHPRVLPGSTLLLDRHYNSLTPYRRNERNLYAVRYETACIVRYVEISGDHLVLRPQNQSAPVQVLTIKPGEHYGDSVVGRVCQVAVET